MELIKTSNGQFRKAIVLHKSISLDRHLVEKGATVPSGTDGTCKVKQKYSSFDEGHELDKDTYSESISRADPVGRRPALHILSSPNRTNKVV